MLFSTSLVAIVGVGNKPTTSPRRLRILNTKKKTNICELTFPTAVLSIKLNRKRLVVVLVDQIYIYDISCMKLLHTIETSPNENALCDLSSSDDSILIYPAPGPNVASPFSVNDHTLNNNNNSNNSNNNGGNSKRSSTDSTHEVGTVVLFDALNIAPLNIIKAHKTQLASISLNNNGTLFATASNKGTIIRIFNTISGNKVHEFRRGSYSALIHKLTFNLSSTLIAATSDTETVHIFKLQSDNDLSGSGSGNDLFSSGELIDEGVGNSTGTNNDDGNNNNNQSDDNLDELEERIIPKAINSNSKIEPKRQPSIADRIYQNLPKNISSILEPQRDFAYLRTPNPHKIKSVVGFNGKNVLVGSTDGSLYVHTIPPRGGECVLVKQYTFDS
ncbi:putative WD repeat-containing protein [Wickerhamomyces ciferrii]|uniref:WD repeat-containing protein n=1 Tax=Wickerhamomyces ciferrii (strain ATCC 14091 / BCRC 22168 / CBS 111 / JCM 3599 / NBRC 0793 / NRRL Y-1031 F-60-10) TaxID=1206466 RepID=K0KXE0_WICCF|nr:putative WD repeat-containing protein [Wickerhamomyces ciferrii]CCH46702.1 putative WD repeat-containing protein [Wickerhamomyces ciferrii]